MKKILFHIVFIVLSIAIFAFTIRGDKGNPIYYQSEHDTRLLGPFEASNSSSRYALIESIVENHSFTLSEKLARFSSPDLVDYNGKYISIFTPGVSLIGIPFYLLGKLFGIPQLATYASITIFSVVNSLLIAFLSRRLGASLASSFLAGFIFLFATNAFPYALTLTQHHITVTLILLGILVAASKKSFINYFLFGGIFGTSIIVDIPNLFLMLPALFYLLYNSIHFQVDSNKLKISFKTLSLGILVGLIPFIVFFAYYNYQTTGSYTKIGQNIGRSKLFRENLPSYLTADVKPEDKKKEVKKTNNAPSLPFNTRLQLNGFYTLLISNERAWIFYSPILFLGLLGFIIAFLNKKTQAVTAIIVSMSAVNVVMYAMFADPWGGWAFGPRYLIPSAALFAIGVGTFLTKYKRSLFVIPVFLVLLGYSIFINSAGSLTTNNIPPKVEAVALPDPIPYTYKYNFQILDKNQSSSLAYNLFFFNKTSSRNYFYFVFSSITAVGVGLYALTFFERKKKA